MMSSFGRTAVMVQECIFRYDFS